MSLRIIHLATARTWRGGEQQVAYLTGELSRHEQVEQCIVCTRHSAMHRYCLEQKLPHVALRKGFSFNLWFAYQLKKIGNQFNASLLHLHDPHAHQFGVLAADIFGNKTPMVLARRVDYPIKNNAYTLYKYNHPLIERIVCVSEAVKQVMLPVVKNPNKLVRIYSGIDLERYRPQKTGGILRSEFNLSPDEIIIGNTGALSPQKDYYTFLNTARQLLDAGVNARFFIIGQGEQEKDLKRYANEKGLSGKVIFTGFRTDVPDILPDFDLFLSTSGAEGLGTSVAAAMACGIPVVATQSGGVTEMVVHQKTGLVAPVGNSALLAQLVLSLLHQPQLATQLSRAGVEHIQQFSKQNTAQHTYRLYREILSSHNSAPKWQLK